MPSLIIKTPEGDRTEPIDPDTLPLAIGRARDNHLILDDSSVSRRHAIIQRAGDRLIIEDLKSLNGVWVNGHPITNGKELQNRDRIMIGDFDIEFIA